MILLPGAEDKQIWSYFASVAFPREHLVRSVIEHLDTEKATSTPALEPLVELNRTRLEMVLKVLDVDGAVKRVKGGWISTGEPWVYDAERYGRLDDARQAEQAAMVEYQSITTCRMTFLREQLDDPGLTSENSQCGRCDNCTGNRYDTTVDTAALDETRARLQRPGFDLEPRKMWPTGLSKLGVKLSGKITRGARNRAHSRTDVGPGLGSTSPRAFRRSRRRGTRCGGQRVYQRSGRLELGRATHRCHGPRIHNASFVGVEPGCQVGRGRAIDRPGHSSLAPRPPSGVGSKPPPTACPDWSMFGKSRT